MIILNKFDEFGGGMGFPSMKDFFEDERYEHQDKIIKYLKSGTVTMLRMTSDTDKFTGEPIGGETFFMNDGKYSWISSLSYYVEKYNLRLPEHFEKHVLKEMN